MRALVAIAILVQSSAPAASQSRREFHDAMIVDTVKKAQDCPRVAGGLIDIYCLSDVVGETDKYIKVLERHLLKEEKRTYQGFEKTEVARRDLIAAIRSQSTFINAACSYNGWVMKGGVGEAIRADMCRITLKSEWLVILRDAARG